MADTWALFHATAISLWHPQFPAEAMSVHGQIAQRAPPFKASPWRPRRTRWRYLVARKHPRMQGAECPLEFFKQNPPCNFHAGFILVPCAPDASHVVSQCRETLGAERIRALHDASKCHETHNAERMRACHMVSQCHETFGAEYIRASRHPRARRRGV